jgi:uncharacterized membrane protein YfcA
VQSSLAVLSGSIVGFSLGLIGGGGSILAVPLLLYVVGVTDPHIAIGTSALAVAVNAFANLVHHARAGTVKWPCAAVFAGSGVAGALLGSTLGKAVDGQKLLVLFSILMVVIAASMLRRPSREADAKVRLTGPIAFKLAAIGFATGTLSGFFGIGGGFLIVPGLMLASGMPIINAIGSSLFSVGTFGLTTAVNYAWSGLVDWPISGLFIAGGVAGGFIGMKSAVLAARRRGMLTRIFAFVILAVAAYMLFRSFKTMNLF